MSTEQYVADLRQRVAKLEAEVQFLYKHLGLAFVPEAAPPLDPQIIEQVQKGKTIEAVMLHRKIYNSTLVEAKQAIDDLQKRGY
jgi:hypothetical protein